MSKKFFVLLLILPLLSACSPWGSNRMPEAPAAEIKLPSMEEKMSAEENMDEEGEFSDELMLPDMDEQGLENSLEFAAEADDLQVQVDDLEMELDDLLDEYENVLK